MLPLTVTATLDTPSVGLVEQPLMLDGPLAWAAAMAAHAAGETIEPITRDHAPDLDLPLARWHEHGTWGWCTSQATLDVASYTAVEIRRKPAVDAMARYTRERQHHAALGPHKARDTTVAAAWVRTAVWQVVATDPDRLAALLRHLTHLGRHRNLGLGHVTAWTITPGADPDGWRHRPMPGPGQPRRGYRPPYHHPTRQIGGEQ